MGRVSFDLGRVSFDSGQLIFLGPIRLAFENKQLRMVWFGSIRVLSPLSDKPTSDVRSGMGPSCSIQVLGQFCQVYVSDQSITSYSSHIHWSDVL